MLVEGRNQPGIACEICEWTERRKMKWELKWTDYSNAKKEILVREWTRIITVEGSYKTITKDRRDSSISDRCYDAQWSPDETTMREHK